jgi:hypothetical protein
MEYIPYLIIILSGIHFMLSYECSKIAKRKGLKAWDTFLVSIFGSPIVGFLYIIVQQLPAINEENETEI